MTPPSNIQTPDENPYLISAPPELKDMELGGLKLKIATTAEEIKNAQELRYKVFYEELGANPTEQMRQEKRDFDSFDDVCTHLLVVDTNGKEDKVVGTYRMFLQKTSDEMIPFYTEGEFDISNLKKSAQTLMEVGRSCILPDYRTRFALQLLWQGLGAFVFHHNVDFLFGCASFPGTDIQQNGDMLSYLAQNHLARDEIRPKALDHLYQTIDLVPAEKIDTKKVIRNLPPLIKGYLRLGGVIGNGAIIDEQFDTIDICIMVERDKISAQKVNYYRRDRK